MRCRTHDLELETVEALLAHMIEHQISLEETVALDLSKLTDAVNQAVQAEQAAVTALNDLSSKLASDGNTEDQAAVDSIAANLTGSTAPLAVATKTDDPNPLIPAPATGAEASTSNNATVASTPVDTTPVAVQPVTTAVGKPLYEHVGGSEVDGASWPNSGLTTPDGTALYYFAGDAAGGAATGGSNEWQVYTGPVQQNADNPLTDNTAATQPESGSAGPATVAQTSAPSTAPVTTDQTPTGEGGQVGTPNGEQLAGSSEANSPAQSEGVSGAGTDGPVTGGSV